MFDAATVWTNALLPSPDPIALVLKALPVETALMTVTLAAAFLIRSFGGGLSPIHLFVPLTLFRIAGALWNVGCGNIKGHRNAMIGLYVGGLLLAGALTLLPGRLVHRVLFG
jgi:uncharacterized membrane protein